MICDVPSTGSLKAHSIPYILMCLSRQKATGTLAVAVQGIIKKVYLSKGEAVFSSSTYADDRLGEMLLKAGKITVEQYDKSVELLKKTGKRQGAILVDLGYLTPKDLFWGVKYQVREIIFSLFQLEDGQYEFIEGPIPSDEVITLKMTMGNLIYEGVKRIDNWTKIRKEMPDTGVVVKLSDNPLNLFQEVELGTNDRKVLSLVDGKRAIKNIIEDSWLNSFEALRTLYLLWTIGIIEEGRAEARPVPVEDILQPVSEEEGEFKAKVDDLFGRLDEANYFELLGVGADADSETIKKSYYALAKEFHPDRFYDSADMELKEKLARIFDALTDAYNAVKDEEGRALYFSSGRLATVDKAGAEKKFKEAVARLKTKDFKAAAEHLKEALRIDPGNADYWSHLALAASKLPGGLAEAEKALHEAIMLEPTSGEYYANLGLLYLSAKRTEEARKQFEKALALEPDNQKAKKGLTKLG